ncbi:MAG: ribosome biogenesis GTPase Der [Myxococcota bacterium]|jgi:GTP-binding protein|nr:ribosome biogenesis GTPase Der [Myxococcota bacterium]
MSFIIAIVGRPNVGKSRMFNRLSSTTKAIVHDYEGVTRDRQYARGEWYGKNYTIIDTGGFLPTTEEPMLVSMRLQAQLAIEEADAILFMMDGRAGITNGDREIATMLRQTEKPVFHIVNKLDSPGDQTTALSDFFELGMDLFPLSAEHGPGIDALMDTVAEIIPAEEDEEEESPHARICVVGKPNAGKSSIINKLLGEDRLLTSDVAGTTRDSVDTTIFVDDKQYVVIDTAGLRRKRSISEQLEHYAVVQAIKSIDRADVAIIVIDAKKGLTSQDKKIAAVVANRGRACIFVVNKWDLIDKDSKTVDEWRKALYHEMPFLDWAPVLFTSALTGKRVQKILENVDHVFERYTHRIRTSELNRFLEKSIAMHNPPVQQNKRIRFYFASQVASRPPAFVFMVNHPEIVPDSYKRYLENRLREDFDFHGTPLKIMMRARRRRE